VDHQVVCPTLFGEYFPAVEDPGAAVALARAYNDWAVDLAGGGAGRLHPSAVLPLQDLEAAVAEVDRVRDLGLRAVTLRPMFYRVPGADIETTPLQAAGGAAPTNPNGIYLVHPAFEPLWDKLEQSGLVVCLHPYLGIANDEGVSEGSFTERVSEKLGIGHTVAEPVAYMEDGAMFIVVAAFHGLFEDHPNLKLALLHSGASMLPLALEKAETYLWLAPFTPVGRTPVSLEPREVFERARTLVAFDGWESSAVRLEDSLATKRAWGSRYPYHDASSPSEVMALCERYDVPEQKVRRLLGGNAAALFDLTVPSIGSAPRRTTTSE
jgi:predicted TIM-barrel fold metal-dependent hydrolase